MATLDDGEVISALAAVRGIGLWSAQAFLIRQLHRPDVLPATDKGIQLAIQRLWQLAKPHARRSA
jgi:DNA-3-methyladenine glycosylase II